MLQKWRWGILCVAWVTALIALFVPYSTGLFGEHTLFLALGAIAMVCTGELKDPVMLLFALAELIFLLSPILVLRSRAVGRVAERVISVCLLGAWIPLLFEDFRHGRSLNGTQEHLLAGYYLLAGAHTTAFIACVLPSDRPPKASTKRGFSVIRNEAENQRRDASGSSPPPSRGD